MIQKVKDWKLSKDKNQIKYFGKNSDVASEMARIFDLLPEIKTSGNVTFMISPDVRDEYLYCLNQFGPAPETIIYRQII